MKDKDPLVSIIMPVFNVSSFVEEAIQSVIDQSYDNWELIIINDGSKDDTADKCKLFQDQRIQYVEQNNRGVSNARNMGLAMMRGDFFCFLDGDDVLPMNSLALRVSKFVDDTIHFVDGYVKIFDRSMIEILRIWKPQFHGNPKQSLVSLDGSCFFGSTWMIRRIIGTRYQFDEQITHGEDLLFYLWIASQGKYTFVNDFVLHYRKSEMSAMSNLEGLAHGYLQIKERLKTISGISPWHYFIFRVRIRKIMFLSFFKTKQYWKGIQFLLFESC